MVLLNDITNVTASEFTRLQRFVENGRSLLLLFGANTDSAGWNELLSNPQTELGFRLQEPSAIDDWRIDPMEYASPIVAPFAAYPDAGLLTTPIFRLWKIALNEDESKHPEIDLKYKMVRR